MLNFKSLNAAKIHECKMIMRHSCVLLLTVFYPVLSAKDDGDEMKQKVIFLIQSFIFCSANKACPA